MQTIFRLYFDLAYRFSKPRWDTGVPPPELKALVEDGKTKGRALDVGCGTGTNAIYLAQQGYATVGVDFSPKAIKLAKEKARRANIPVDFQIGDVTRLDFLQGHSISSLMSDAFMVWTLQGKDDSHNIWRGSLDPEASFCYGL